jgi:hypothetical protein
MGSTEKFLEYIIGGTLVIMGLAAAILILGPFVLGYVIVQIAWRAYDAICPRLFPEKRQPIYYPKKQVLQYPVEKDRQLAEERDQNFVETESPIEQEEEPEEIEEPQREQLIFNKNFYLERKLNHGQKEALFAQGYKRLKISSYGDSGAAYYWVKTRYNESKEHAFFCYLIEKELRKHTKEVDLFINNGPDVIIRHHGNAFAFDVETGKNLNRKPEDTRIKFERYRDGYFRSYIFVTNKALKRKYKKMGIVVTRSTLKNVIKAIFS